MRAHDSSGCPRCPDCHARHYPATLGSGARVWCAGTSAESVQETQARARALADARLEQEHKQARKRLHRKEHARRMESGRACIDAIDAARIPDSF